MIGLLLELAAFQMALDSAYLLLTQLPQWNNNNWYTNCWQLNR
jgi:hypothetical protein